MTRRCVIALLVVLAQVVTLASTSGPIQAASSMAPAGIAGMPCEDADAMGDGADEGAAGQRLPCCAPMCCVGVSVPDMELALARVGDSPAPVPVPTLASLTVAPDDRPPKV